MPGYPGGYRIIESETIAVLVQSSLAMDITGDFRIIYDDGKTELFHVTTFRTAALREVQIAPTNRTAKKNGWVVGCVLGIAAGSPGSPKRGQTYVRAEIGGLEQPGGLSAGTQIILADYCYNGYSPTLGVFHEPGPGGGEGNFLLNPIINAEATGADFLVDLGPPTNTIWKVHELKIKYKASAGVGTRSIATTRLDEDGVGIWSLAAMAPTASQDADIYMTDILIAERGSIAPVDIAMEIQTRPFMLPEGHVIRLEDTADISATDAVSVFGVVEEWLVI